MSSNSITSINYNINFQTPNEQKLYGWDGKDPHEIYDFLEDKKYDNPKEFFTYDEIAFEISKLLQSKMHGKSSNEMQSIADNILQIVSLMCEEKFEDSINTSNAFAAAQSVLNFFRSGRTQYYCYFLGALGFLGYRIERCRYSQVEEFREKFTSNRCWNEVVKRKIKEKQSYFNNNNNNSYDHSMALPKRVNKETQAMDLFKVIDEKDAQINELSNLIKDSQKKIEDGEELFKKFENELNSKKSTIEYFKNNSNKLEIELEESKKKQRELALKVQELEKKLDLSNPKILSPQSNNNSITNKESSKDTEQKIIQLEETIKKQEMINTELLDLSFKHQEAFSKQHQFLNLLKQQQSPKQNLSVQNDHQEESKKLKSLLTNLKEEYTIFKKVITDEEKDHKEECIRLKEKITNLESKLTDSEQKLADSEQKLDKTTKLFEETMVLFGNELKYYQDKSQTQETLVDLKKKNLPTQNFNLQPNNNNNLQQSPQYTSSQNSFAPSSVTNNKLSQNANSGLSEVQIFMNAFTDDFIFNNVRAIVSNFNKYFSSYVELKECSIDFSSAIKATQSLFQRFDGTNERLSLEKLLFIFAILQLRSDQEVVKKLYFKVIKRRSFNINHVNESFKEEVKQFCLEYNL